ncbi:hypothetical protein Tco_1280790, partial [Tanacetum coccineum]
MMMLLLSRLRVYLPPMKRSLPLLLVEIPFPDLKMVRSLLTNHEMRLKSRVQNPLVDATSASPMVLLAKSNTSCNTPKIGSQRNVFPGALLHNTIAQVMR